MERYTDLQRLFSEFIFECEYARKLRPDTLRGYKGAFQLFIKLVPDTDVESITAITITQFFKTLEQRQRLVGKGVIKTGVKRATIATYWSKLNGFFQWLKVKEYIKVNPFNSMVYPTPNYDDKKFLSRSEIEKILTAILKNPGKSILTLKRNLALFHVLLFCGLRKEELALLQIRDVDLNKRILIVRKETSKSGRTRFLPIHSQAIMHLKDYLNERKKYQTPYLFVSSTKDEQLGYAGLNYFVNQLRYRSGVRFHLHQLRHTFAVNFLKSSNNVVKLKQLLGHTNISMTMLYVRCLPPNEIRADVEGMNIDSFV